MSTVLATVLLSLGAAGVGHSLPAPPDTRAVLALAARPTGACNAATFFEQAETAYFKGQRAAQAPLPAGDPVLGLVLQGMSCGSCSFPYSQSLAVPPTEQRIPASRPYRAAAETFVRSGRELMRAGRQAEAEAEFRKAIVLGRLLYEDPGITVIQDAVSLSILSRGAEGLGDLALARGDRATAEGCARFIAETRAYLEGSSRFVKGLPYQGLLDRPADQSEIVAAVAALDRPGLRLSLRVEVLMFVALARPLLGAVPAAADEALERARHDDDPRMKALGEWGSGLGAGEARRVIRMAAVSPWP